MCNCLYFLSLLVMDESCQRFVYACENQTHVGSEGKDREKKKENKIKRGGMRNVFWASDAKDGGISKEKMLPTIYQKRPSFEAFVIYSYFLQNSLRNNWKFGYRNQCFKGILINLKIRGAKKKKT